MLWKNCNSGFKTKSIAEGRNNANNARCLLCMHYPAHELDLVDKNLR